MWIDYASISSSSAVYYNRVPFVNVNIHLHPVNSEFCRHKSSTFTTFPSTRLAPYNQIPLTILFRHRNRTAAFMELRARKSSIFHFPSRGFFSISPIQIPQVSHKTRKPVRRLVRANVTFDVSGRTRWFTASWETVENPQLRVGIHFLEAALYWFPDGGGPRGEFFSCLKSACGICTRWVIDRVL